MTAAIRPTPAPGATPLLRVVATGLGVFRITMWAWATTLVIVERDALIRSTPAWSLLAAAGMLSFWLLWAARRRIAAALAPAAVVAELLVGGLILAADPNVMERDTIHTFGSAWPVTGTLAAGLVRGPAAGGLAGLWLTIARAVGAGVDPSVVGFLSALASGSLFVLTGIAGGWMFRRLQESEDAIAEAKVRESLARELHDGVLQTLAVIQRRSGDPELVGLARDQEKDLRALVGLTGAAATDQSPSEILKRHADRAAMRWDVDLQWAVVVPPELSAESAELVGGALGEIVNNAGKHGGASRATVFVDESDTGIQIEVADDGAGFDPAATTERGLTRSVRRPVAEAGGTVSIDSTPGRGTTVVLTVPSTTSDPVPGGPS